jgi:hypothetical protein
MSLGEFLWSFLALYCLFFYFVILFRVVDDLFRDPDRSGWGKAGWITFLLVLPFISLFVYLISNGAGMAERAMQQALAQEQRQREYIREVAGTADRPAAPPPATAAEASAAPDLPSQSQQPSRSPSSTR